MYEKRHSEYVKRNNRGDYIYACLVTVVPVAAEALTASLNLFRIRTATDVIAEIGENYTPVFGRSAPATIYYDDKAYIQLELVENIFRGQLLWDGRTNTITLLDSDTFSGKAEIEVPTFGFYVGVDALGNTWHYGLRRNTTSGMGTGDLLWALDLDSRNSWAIGLASRTACEFSEEGIYYAKREMRSKIPYVKSLVLVYLPYLNSADDAYGTEIAVASANPGSIEIPQVIMAGGHMVYSEIGNYPQESSFSIYSINYENPGQIITLAQHSPVYQYTDTAFELLKDGYLYYHILTGQRDYVSYDDFEFYRVKIDGSEEPELLKER